MKTSYLTLIWLTLGSLISVQPALAQRKASKSLLSPTSAEHRLIVGNQRDAAEVASWTSGLPLRCVGPTIMSGRVADIAVMPGDGSEFYVAYASGGLWHTTNHGTSFEPLFDDALSITLGAVAVHPNTRRIWAGTGEVNSSRSSYAGTGIYTSDDDGLTWEHRGLENTQHIGQVVLHPSQPEVAWVAALGPLYSDNHSGGVYRTQDGGESWDLVLKSPGIMGNAGAVDLILDESNPNHLFAAMWDRTRRAWDFTESGDGSGIWESRDGGSNWIELSSLMGFPNDVNTGRIGLAWHAEAQQLFALVDNQMPRTNDDDSSDETLPIDFIDMDAQEFAQLDSTALQKFLEEHNFPEEHDATDVFARVANGTIVPSALHDYLTDGNRALFDAEIAGAEVYRLDFNGEAAAVSWSRTHTEPLEDVCYTYGYYFGLIEVDPSDPMHLWIAGVPLIQSKDGGATWSSIGASNVHVDHHFLWADPMRPGHLINGNDGGVNISWDSGEHWIKCNSPAVGQFYTVEVDDAEPYQIYGGLQDNGTWVGPSNYRFSPGWLQNGRYPWESIGGGDGMQVEVDPRNPTVVITGSQFGWYNRIDRAADDYTSIHPHHTLGEKPLRWNWQTPIWLSRHQPDILFMASNRFHRSFDQGRSWETLSEDLTRGGKSGNVPFGTITTLHESPMRFGQLAIGTDDGIIQVSRDGGYHWNSLSSPIPQDPTKDRTLWVSEVLWSAHETNRLYVALNGYRLDHFESWVFTTNNDGRTWKRLGRSDQDGGLPSEPVNALAESSSRKGVLFAGTDGGAFGSFDGGNTWGSVHPDMPHVPVHDLVIQERENDLVMATHGRSIWVLELDAMWQNWPSDLSWAEALKDSVALTELEDIVWEDNWGEKGWAWSDPRDVTTSVALFSPKQLDAHWVIRIDSTQQIWSTDSISIHKGWQSINISLQQQLSEGLSDYPTPGTYTVELQDYNEQIISSAPLIIKEEEKEED